MNAGSVQTPGPDEQSMFKRAGAWAFFLLRPVLALAEHVASTPYRIKGPSMEPVLVHGDYVLAHRILARGRLARGDTVVFASPGGAVTIHAKRIVGMPNETVGLENGRVKLDDEVISEPYLDSGVRTDPKSAFTEWFLDPDEYFVLGDTRSDSYDSRDYGPVKQEAIVGKVWLRFWPLRRFGPVRSR